MGFELLLNQGYSRYIKIAIYLYLLRTYHI